MAKIWFTCPQCGLQLDFPDQTPRLCPRCGQPMQLGRFGVTPRPSAPLPPPMPSGAFPPINGPQPPLSGPPSSSSGAFPPMNGPQPPMSGLLPPPPGPPGPLPISGPLPPPPRPLGPQPQPPGPLPQAGWPGQPPMMPPRQPVPGTWQHFTLWFSRRSKRQKFYLVLGTCLAFVLVCGCIGVVGATNGTPNDGAATATATPVRVARATKTPRPPTATATIDTTPSATPTPKPTATATSTPRPTATPGPRPITAAIFGGLIDAFTAKYGQPTPIKVAGGYYYFTLADGTKVQLLVQDDEGNTVPDFAYDGKNHATLVQVSPADTQITWPDNTCKQVLDAFMPPDAKYVKDVQGLDLEHVYVSAALAATFPADAFTDASGNRLPPGTFYTDFQGSFALNGGCVIDWGE